MDTRLISDSTYIIDLSLCQVRLHHNAAFPWIILIPHQENLVEVVDLSSSDQILLMGQISLASQAMKHLFNPHKLNVANLGNVVPQLHIHIIARYEADKAWPNSVWNSGVTEVYDPLVKNDLIRELQKTFEDLQSEVMGSFLHPLHKAYMTSEEAAKEGFDWSTPFQASLKVKEELDEVVEELKKPESLQRQVALIDEMGDLFFACVSLARHAKVDPDEAIFEGIQKFTRRYERMKSHADHRGISLQTVSSEELSALWKELKKAENTTLSSSS